MVREIKMIDEKFLKTEERAIFALRSLYGTYGYLPYKMSKFEEYELYVQNKDFLVSDRIITFNDTNGRLLALKPDVTLSIIKNGEDGEGVKQKVYYNENVYRVSENTHHYKEIMQSGLECVGDLDLYDFFEVISLAAESLSMISQDFVLEISHLDILSAFLDSVCPDAAFRNQALRYIAEKNPHDLQRLCEKYEVSEENCEKLSGFIYAYGKRDAVIGKLSEICTGVANDALNELKMLSKMLDETPYKDKILFDFSVVNDMSYYNGFVFKGFLNGICEGILSGGQYDKLMAKMGRQSRAIGFALYLDLLEQMPSKQNAYDVDVVLLYGDGDSKIDVARAVRSICEKGMTVSAQRSADPSVRCRQIIKVSEVDKIC